MAHQNSKKAAKALAGEWYQDEATHSIITITPTNIQGGFTVSMNHRIGFLVSGAGVANSDNGVVYLIQGDGKKITCRYHLRYSSPHLIMKFIELGSEWKSKFTVKPSLSAESVEIALDRITRSMPGMQPYVDENRDMIVDPIVEGAIDTIPSIKDEMKAVYDSEELTQSQTAILGVTISAMMVFLGLLGVRLPEEDVGRAMSGCMTGATLDGLNQAIDDFQASETRLDKAKVLFVILIVMFEAGCFGAVFAEMRNAMSWGEWVFAVTVAHFQVATWVDSGAVAFAGLALMSADDLVDSVENAVVQRES